MTENTRAAQLKAELAVEERWLAVSEPRERALCKQRIRRLKLRIREASRKED